jgi:hypothetical protein
MGCFFVRNQLQKVRNAVQPRFPLIVGMDDVPRSMLGIGSLQHHVAGTRIIVPAAIGFHIHGAEFPLAHRIGNPGFEPALLLLLADLQPEFDEDDSASSCPLLHSSFFLTIVIFSQ